MLSAILIRNAPAGLRVSGTALRVTLELALKLVASTLLLSFQQYLTKTFGPRQQAANGLDFKNTDQEGSFGPPVGE